MMNTNSRFVETTDQVFWPEKHNGLWEVNQGYYLASYLTGNGVKHIVARNSITSCVVCHFSEGEIFKTRKEAWASVADKEE